MKIKMALLDGSHCRARRAAPSRRESSAQFTSRLSCRALGEERTITLDAPCHNDAP
jgi:hypothetical protein